MNQNTAASLFSCPFFCEIGRYPCITRNGLFFPVVQSCLDEGIAPREVFDEIFVVHIIHRNVQMFKVLDQRRIIMELPIDHRDDVSNIAIRQGLGPS